MRLRCSRLSIVTVSIAALVTACGTGASGSDTSAVRTPLGTATPTSSLSAQGLIDQQETMLQATPSRSVTPEIPAGLVPVRLVKAFDGDSGIAADNNGEFEFRLYGIDAPERNDVSRNALVRLVAAFGNDLYADDRDVDRYGRRVVVLRKLDGSRSINIEMVRQGYAHAYLDYGVLDGVLAAAEEAESNQRGVWASSPTAMPKAGLTPRQEDILATVRQRASVTTERLWELTYEFIHESRSGSYDDGYAVGRSDSSGCEGLLLLAQRLMDASHPALGDNILTVVVQYFGSQASRPYAQGYLDGYGSVQGCTPWNNISPHARLSATEEGRFEMYNNALAADPLYTGANSRVQLHLDSLFQNLNAHYAAIAILNPEEDGPDFRDYAGRSLSNLADFAWWCDAFDYLLDTYSTPGARLSGSQTAALNELHGQALNLYIEALRSGNPHVNTIETYMNGRFRAAQDANPAIGSWEFVSQRGHPCSS